MLYDFKCEKCGIITLSFGMNDSDGRKNAKCPNCGSSVERLMDAPAICMKGEYLKAGTVVNKNFKHKDVEFGFADYGKNKGTMKDSIGNRFKGVRVDEKSGKMVIDVISNRPDPLGTIEKDKKTKTEKQINQSYKRRK